MKKSKLLIGTLLCAGALQQGLAQEQKAYIVSNAHFDTQWNWDVQRTIGEYVPKTLEQNLMLLARYPGYIFNFEGGIKYAWMKEYYPYLYEQMKQYVRQGRWHVTGSTWDATDTNIPSPESFTRNILYGQHFFRDELGVESTDIFLPDCFGFGWTLPTIAAHSGLIGFSTQKLQWRNHPFYGNSKIPFEIGLWQGVDGSRIMLVADAHNYTTKWTDADLSHNSELAGQTANSPLHAVYHYYGTGDTGGAPTIESVRAVEKGLKGDGPVRIISATSDQLYKDYLPFESHPELPVFNNELLMDVHGTGCYTSQAAMKLYNRRNELLADAAERAAVTADWLGVLPYPKETLDEAWKRFIWHQFHDDLTGTSIPRAYHFSWNDELLSMKQFARVLTSSTGALARGLDTQMKGTPLVIYNPAAYAVSDVVEVEFTPSKPASGFSVFNESGVQVASQVLENHDGKVRLLVAATVPSLGCAVYDIRPKSGKAAASTLSASGRTLENSVYRLTLDENGDIASILDKRCNRELVAPGKAVRLALFTENESYHWPAWEIMKKEIDKAPVAIGNDVRISVAEEGPLRAALCVERSHGDSRFKQYIRLNEGGESDRIDIVNEVDWHTTNALLKAEFPLSVSNPKATYDLGIGSVERGNNTTTAYEVCAQQWADLTGTGRDYGVSVLNDCKYGWDKPSDNLFRLTLLHTPKTASNYPYQDRQDFGHHRFTYSIVGHQGDLCRATATRKAEVLNQSLHAFIAPKHKGTLGRSFSLAQADNANVSLKAFKRAEKGEGYIVRFYETSGREAQKVNFTLPADIASATEVNGVEDNIGQARFSGRTLTFDIKPNSIKSFRISLHAPAQSAQPLAQAPVALEFDTKTASFNAFRRDANFDGKGHSYPAELFPQEVVWGGIRFCPGEPDARNGLKCRGQQLTLPEGSYNRLYLLAACTAGDRLSTFRVGHADHQAIVPSYTGFIGQWGHDGDTEGYLKPADVAYVGTHRHDLLHNRDLPYEFAYMFCISLPLGSKDRTVQLPDDPQVVIFAATVASDDVNTLVPASDLLHDGLPLRGADSPGFIRRNLLHGKPVVERSGEVNARERAELAADENPETKWCDTGDQKAKYIAFDLGREEEIKGWHVMHASLESLDYTTKEYCLQVKQQESDPWRTVDSVADNTDIETDRMLSVPVTARYVRLYITKPDQSEGRVARVYEFEVY